MLNILKIKWRAAKLLNTSDKPIPSTVIISEMPMPSM
jgi:hypothetical protein